MEQLETLTSSSQETQSLPDSVEDQDDKAKTTTTSKEEESSSTKRTDESEATPERDDKMSDQFNESRESSPAPEQAKDEASASLPTSARANKSDEHEQGFEQAPIEQETLTGDEAEKDEQRAQQQAAVAERERGKSRWLFMANGAASKRPTKAALATSMKLASAKQIYFDQANSSQSKRQNRFGATKSSSSKAKSNSEYKLVMPNDSESTTATGNGEEEEQPVGSSSTPAPSTTTTTTTTTTAIARDCPDRQSESKSAESDTANSSNQDEVSFEAIASAISKSLSDSRAMSGGEGAETTERGADTEAPARAMAEMLSEAIASSARPSDGPESSAAVDDETESSSGESSPGGATDGDRLSDGQSERAAKRRRTTGEHLAEVIDHIVDKRNHQRARFGDRSAALDEASSRLDHREGPQIVVVAPVGPNGALLKARSLTKEAPAKSEAKVGGSGGDGAKKPSEAAKKRPAAQQKPARIGGRLLGVAAADSNDPKQKSNGLKYSERVEVIEDDDSSALLAPSPSEAMVKSGPLPSDGAKFANDSDDGNEEDDVEQEERKSSERNQMASQQADLLALNQEQLSSVHVSSHSGEARSRSPRHEASSRQMFERYAPINVQQSPVRYQQQQAQQQSQQQPPQQKLYSAEQVIMEHVLKSKARSLSEQQQQRPQTAQQLKQQSAEPNKKQRALSNGKQITQEASSTTTTTTSSSASSTTTGQPPAAASAANDDQAEQHQANGSPQQTRPQQRQQQQQQQTDQIMMMMAPSEQSASEAKPANSERHYQPNEQQQAQAEYASMQPVQVPALFIRQSHQMQQRPRQFLQDPYQTMESQQQHVRMVGPAQVYAEPAQEQQAQAVSESQQRDQQPAANQHQYQGAQQQLKQQVLPVFADQEIQVPAHLAESVIRDLQQAPSTVQGMINGQPALFQAQPTMMAQVPMQQPRNHHLSQQQQQHQMMMMMMMQQQQSHHHQRPHHMHSAESHQRPTFASGPEQAQQQQPQTTSYLRQALNYSPLAFMSRLARRQPSEQQQLHQDQMALQQQQVLASRASTKEEPRKLQPIPDQPQDSSLLDTAVKALGPKGRLIQPVAQMALKNLFSSLGQQAAAQQAEADAREQQQQQRSQQQRSSQQAAPQQTPEVATAQEQLAAAGSSPAAVLAESPQGARSMRSLPIGAQAPVSQRQMQPIAMASAGPDQEAQESYGQMPAYHMAPQYGGGGGEHYQGDHDKKTKGITFHFGGGPIGGGTQLITSPMGIFKHLMIPLLPNPRVNLNGKVVFGVVLEKSTAFGPPPKKKHFLWG